MILLNIDREKEKRYLLKRLTEIRQGYSDSKFVYHPRSKGESKVILYDNGKEKDFIYLDSLADSGRREWKTSSLEEYKVDNQFSIYGFSVLKNDTEKKEDITSLANILLGMTMKDYPEYQSELKAYKQANYTGIFSLEQLEMFSDMVVISIGLRQLIQKEIDRATRIIEYLYKNIIFTYQIRVYSYDFCRFEFYRLENFVPYLIFDRLNMEAMTRNVSFHLKDIGKYSFYLKRLLPLSSDDYEAIFYKSSKREEDTYQEGQDFFFSLDTR